MFSAAQAPFLGQMSQLNENISLLLSVCEEESEEDGETASVEESGRVDMEADTAATRTGDATFTRTRSGLIGQREAHDKLKVKLDKYTQPENVKGLRTPRVNPSFGRSFQPR